MIHAPLRRCANATLAAVVLLCSSCLVWRNQWRSTTAVRVADDVAYIDDGTDKHRLDVFAPKDAHAAPVVIFVHGGFWREGDRSFYEPVVGLYGNVGTALGERGVVTVVPSYRLWPAVRIAEQLDDIAAVVRWTQQHAASFGGDPQRIILAGHSAGGHLVTTLAVQPGVAAAHGLSPDAIKGLVAISGIYDVVTTVASATPEARASFWSPLFGDEAAQRAVSPITVLNATDASWQMPIAFLIGENDFTGCRRDYDAVHAALATDPRARFALLPGNTHEQMVLEIGTAEDAVGPRIATFAHSIGAELKPDL
jgi:acetyl esterase/lipase